MKKLFKKSVLSSAIIALGTVVGYAETTAFQGLYTILGNFDYILNLDTSKQAEIDERDTAINDNTELETKIKTLKEYTDQFVDVEVEGGN